MTSVFDNHPPICPNFFCKRNYVLKQVPTNLLVQCLKIRSFFRASLYTRIWDHPTSQIVLELSWIQQDPQDLWHNTHTGIYPRTRLQAYFQYWEASCLCLACPLTTNSPNYEIQTSSHIFVLLKCRPRHNFRHFGQSETSISHL